MASVALLARESVRYWPRLDFPAHPSGTIIPLVRLPHAMVLPQPSDSMSIYERSYYQDDEPRGIFLGGAAGGPMTLVTKIVILNVAIVLVDSLFLDGKLSDAMAVQVATLSQPWQWWRLLTSGFAHSPSDFSHVIFNMFTLWIFGRALEQKYGQAEFLRFYLTAIVLSSVAWAAIEKLNGAPPLTDALGASGAVFAVVIAFAMNFPKVQLLLFFAIPIPAWSLGVVYIVFDVFHMLSPPADGPQVAHYAHLAGALFGFLYVKFHWNLRWLSPAWLAKLKPRRGSKLRIHDPEAKLELDAQVDQILQKIVREGEGSLTRRERQIMQKASREYQERKRR